MTALRAIALLLLSIATAANADDSLLDVANDRIVRRALVPSPEQRVGEVRIVRRGDAQVVQTLLYSKILSRVVSEIRKKEAANWPPGAPGHPDAERYGAALAQVQEQIWDRLPRSEAVRDRRQKMWIEFVLAPQRALVAIGPFEMQEAGGEVKVVKREALVVFEPSRGYVERNMRLIEVDAFGSDGEKK